MKEHSLGVKFSPGNESASSPWNSKGIMIELESQKPKVHWSVDVIFLFVLVSFICLFRMSHHHDWGDDFAGYVMQAKATAEGNLQSETKYVYTDCARLIGPKVLPPVFPLLLSPIVKLTDINIPVLMWVNRLLFVGWVLIMWFYVKRQLGLIGAITTLVLFVFNPYMIETKNELFSDFLFCFILFVLFYFWSFPPASKWRIWIIALLVALLIGTRTVGFAVMPALFCSSLLGENRKSELRQFLKIAVLAIVFLLGINLAWVGSSGHQTIADYLKIFSGYNPVQEVVRNFSGYGKLFTSILIPYGEVPWWSIMPVYIITALLMIIGLINTITDKRWSFIHWFVVFYMAVLFLYPSRYAVFRFLLPVFPVVLFWIYHGGYWCLKQIEKVLTVKVSWLVLLLPMVYFPNLRFLHSHPALIDSTQSELANEAYLNIQKFTQPNDTLWFQAPRALALFTDRYSRSICNDQWNECKWLFTDFDNKDVQFPESEFELVWHNERFGLWLHRTNIAG